jgi:hypothetical protein
MGTLRKEAVTGVTSRELKSHRFKTLVLPTFIYNTTILGGDLKNSHWNLEGSRERHEHTHDVPRQGAFSDNLSYFVGQIWSISHGIICSNNNLPT